MGSWPTSRLHLALVDLSVNRFWVEELAAAITVKRRLVPAVRQAIVKIECFVAQLVDSRRSLGEAATVAAVSVAAIDRQAIRVHVRSGQHGLAAVRTHIIRARSVSVLVAQIVELVPARVLRELLRLLEQRLTLVVRYL